MLTKAQFRSQVRTLIRDSDEKVWSVGALDVHIEVVLDDLWGELLDAASWLASDTMVITPHSPGYVSLQSVPGGGDLNERFFRIQLIVRDGIRYRYVSPRRVTIEDDTVISAPHYAYTVFADELWLFPLAMSPDVQLSYSYLPPRFTSLLESDLISWPDGYIAAALYIAAGRAMAKTDESERLLLLGGEKFNKLLAAVQRQQIGPMMIEFADSPVEWGGE